MAHPSAENPHRADECPGDGRRGSMAGPAEAASEGARRDFRRQCRSGKDVEGLAARLPHANSIGMKLISCTAAPAPAGHYSQAVVHQGLVYVSGLVPRDTAGDDCPAAFDEQVSLALSNLAQILEAAGSAIGR